MAPNGLIILENTGRSGARGAVQRTGLTAVPTHIFRKHHRLAFASGVYYLPSVPPEDPRLHDLRHADPVHRAARTAAIEFFLSWLEPIVEPWAAVTCVPPEEEGEVGDGEGGTGVEEVARLLARSRIDARPWLARGVGVEVVQPALVAGARVLVLDDGLKGPEMLRACGRALREAGAAEVALLALCRPYPADE